jgi:hypothetical protein
VLRGDHQPAAPAEQLDWARFALKYPKHYGRSARLFAAALTADPKLADQTPGLRSEAARAAVLAGTGRGADAPADGPDRARLRQQALGWLRAELGRVPGPEAGRVLGAWEHDPDLAGVRGEALARLPEPERAAWQKLWADVAARRTPKRP